MTGPNSDNLPRGSLAESRERMRQARPCPCCGTNLVPVADRETPPTLAIACEDCGMIEGDAPTLAEAVANWNELRPVS